MKTHYDIYVKGKVQGVFYRASAREKALALGLFGFVRNEPDGQVYIEAEGEETVLINFVAWCKKGPSRAVVENVHVQKSEIKGLGTFEIRR